MRILQLALFGLLLTQSLFVDAQDELIIEENQAQLLLDDVQNDINELDETQAAKIKEMNEEIKRLNEQKTLYQAKSNVSQFFVFIPLSSLKSISQI